MTRKLTNEQDKFPAISGLVNLLAADTGDTYYAGLWKAHIIEGLNWQVLVMDSGLLCADPSHDHERQAAPTSKSTVKRPAAYRAPSWSWASLDTEIRYLSVRQSHIVAECLACEVVPAGKDPYGRVKSGFIKLQVSRYILLEFRKSWVFFSLGLASIKWKMPFDSSLRTLKIPIFIFISCCIIRYTDQLRIGTYI
jgi:hypothetical protein